eukprot:COSAG02_NODE_11781_length_1655_cov_1.367609_2_plen_140_part_00
MTYHITPMTYHITPMTYHITPVTRVPTPMTWPAPDVAKARATLRADKYHVGGLGDFARFWAPRGAMVATHSHTATTRSRTYMHRQLLPAFHQTSATIVSIALGTVASTGPRAATIAWIALGTVKPRFRRKRQCFRRALK